MEEEEFQNLLEDEIRDQVLEVSVALKVVNWKYPIENLPTGLGSGKLIISETSGDFGLFPNESEIEELL